MPRPLSAYRLAAMWATHASPLRNFFFLCLMTSCSLMRPEVVDAKRRRAAVESLRAARVTLPRWSELADPARISSAVISDLKSVGPDEPDERNLWRARWFNHASPPDAACGPGAPALPQA